MLNDANATFASALSNHGIALEPAGPAYVEEPRGLYHGRDSFVALPKSTEDVAKIVCACAKARVSLIPFGGGTGLVSGQISTQGAVPLILSLERMNQVRAVYQEESTIVVEAGATVTEVQAVADDAGRLFPLSYASQDSARIGGGLSVNSGGLNVLRFGMARDICLGIEAVLPDGQTLHGLKRLRKDNTGYDLRHLLIGAEGTLGVITAAALRLFPKPAETATAFLAVPDPATAIALLSLFQEQLGDAVSAFELIAEETFRLVAETHPDLRQPFAEPVPWAVMIELGTGPNTDPEAMMGTVFEHAAEAGLATDGTIAQSGQQRAEFWAFRETIPESNRRIGAIASHDISLPLSELPGFMAAAPEAIRRILPCRINAFGHVGDGNLHYNVFPPKGESRAAYRDRAAQITRLVHDMTVACGGSFSAEHGIGRTKTSELQRYGDPAKLSAMRAIKTALDPHGIMNPGAVLPVEIG